MVIIMCWNCQFALRHGRRATGSKISTSFYCLYCKTLKKHSPVTPWPILPVSIAVLELGWSIECIVQ